MLESNQSSFAESQNEDNEQLLPERFLSYVFHELRTPLTVVHSYAQIGLDKLPPEPQFDKLRQIMGRMISQGEETVEMIEEMLEASRIPLGHLNLDQTEIEFAQLIDDTVEHLPDALQSNFNFAHPAEPAIVMVDPPRIDRVFTTLIKFVLEEQAARTKSAQINLSYQRLTPGANSLRIELQTPDLILTEAEQENLFDLYRPVRQKSTFHSKAGWLDIGLYVSRGIIEAHGGKLDYAANLPGFIIDLPVHS